MQRGIVASFFAAMLFSTSVASRADDVPGNFDFYVLALSWSPSYCEAEGDGRRDASCKRPFSFVLHGLWPQRERGYPANCRVDGGRLPRSLIDAQLDVYPSPRLVVHQWIKHGSCSGLAPDAYFAAAREAFSAIVVPPFYTLPTSDRMVDVATVERDFIAANPRLPADAIAITCDRQRLRDVRICFDKTLSNFRSCAEVDRRACERGPVAMPAVRRP